MSFRFINHACIEVDFGGGTLLTDPWFYGEVFNDSWELIVQGGAIDYGRIRFIWISHEHPDHLHFPTLRAIREHAEQPITVLYRQQNDKSPAKAIAAMGFELIELNPNVRVELAVGLAVTCYANRSDSALLIESGGKRIFNQNDCRLSLSTLRGIVGVDYWLFQFSIAGYAGNKDDGPALERAASSHIELIERYARALRPVTYVPFASFVSFCHPLNHFLNQWRVTPDTVASLNLPCATRVLAPGETCEGVKGLEYWRPMFSVQRSPKPLQDATDAELSKVGQRFCSTIGKHWPRWTVPKAFCIELIPRGDYAILDMRSGRFSIGDDLVGHAIAKLDRQSLAFMLRYPWGADTIHIAAVATVLDDLRWRWLLYIKHAEYKLARLGRWRSVVPLPLAWVRSRLSKP